MKKRRNSRQAEDLDEIARILATGIVRMKTRQMLLSSCPRAVVAVLAQHFVRFETGDALRGMVEHQDAPLHVMRHDAVGEVADQRSEGAAEIGDGLDETVTVKHFGAPTEGGDGFFSARLIIFFRRGERDVVAPVQAYGHAGIFQPAVGSTCADGDNDVKVGGIGFGFCDEVDGDIGVAVTLEGVTSAR